MDPDTPMDPAKANDRERPGFDMPGPNTKGGGLKGGPKRWTGRGPPPARHIPWPEIFKHHISVIEGHLKMTDMVRKHTKEGTGNHRTVMGVVDRTKEMLASAKQMARTFVPPSNQWDKVPLGSSSVSMYPGYSPADHEYGKAAQEYGRYYSEAKLKGTELPIHPDMEYQVAQSKGLKRARTVSETRATGSGESGNGTPKGSTGSGEVPRARSKDADGDTNLENGQSQSENPYFVVDTNPTPINIARPSMPQSEEPKQDSVEVAEAEGGRKAKKSKKKHSDGLPAESSETQDISEEVEARLRKKEEKKKHKDDKKRKRESEKSELATNGLESTPLNGTAAAAAETPAQVGEGEKPKKKKKKVKNVEDGPALADRTTEKKRNGESENPAGADEGHRKRRKKHKD